jgi:hypothetical protein
VTGSLDVETPSHAGERGLWGAFGPSTDPGWIGDLDGSPLSGSQALRIDEERNLALMRVEGGLCPACGAEAQVVGLWARCPNRGHARGPKSQGPVEFRLVPVDGVARIQYRLTHEPVGDDGRPVYVNGGPDARGADR